MPDVLTSTRTSEPDEPIYRVILFGDKSSIKTAQIIVAQTDEEAKQIALKMVDGHRIELWERNRFLASYPPLLSNRREPLLENG